MRLSHEVILPAPDHAWFDAVVRGLHDRLVATDETDHRFEIIELDRAHRTRLKGGRASINTPGAWEPFTVEFTSADQPLWVSVQGVTVTKGRPDPWHTTADFGAWWRAVDPTNPEKPKQAPAIMVVSYPLAECDLRLTPKNAKPGMWELDIELNIDGRSWARFAAIFGILSAGAAKRKMRRAINQWVKQSSKRLREAYELPPDAAAQQLYDNLFDPKRTRFADKFKAGAKTRRVR